MSTKIQSIRALQILDSRGFPTVEAVVVLEDGSMGRAAVPSGASTGEREAVELRDGDKSKFLGKGCLKACAHVNGEIAQALKGFDAADQNGLDRKMISLDGTENKGKLGANAILAVSMAACRAAANAQKLPLYQWIRQAYGLKLSDYLLPAPMFNVINGGKHADSGLDVQEFMLVPVGSATFSDALRAGCEIYQILKKDLAAMKMVTAVGDEGGFAPHLKTHEEVLEVLTKAVKTAGYEGQVKVSIDAASSEFFGDGKYSFEKKPKSSEEMIEVYAGWLSRYGVISFEDPLAENDWAGWKAMTGKMGGRTRLIGDDLFCTNRAILEKGIRDGVANSILIKLNQIGTLTETVDTVLAARKAGYTSVISHRSGETEDAFIADLAVALNAGAIKTGAPCRSERLAKYNQLLRIEAELGRKAQYAGMACFTPMAAAAR
jgi:enolase